jgi:hypothetical protein
VDAGKRKGVPDALVLERLFEKQATLTFEGD